jgi:3-hydroxyacyl-CoA dehydrogenase
VKSRINKAAVLGAGTMGAQVAAHLAGCGLDVVLLDVAGPGPDRSAAARKGLEALRRLKPSPLHRSEDLAFIRPGNFEDDLGALAGAEWVFEAVVEDPEIKRKLLARVAPALSATALLTTNTSGLGIAALAEALPAAVRPRFFGTHFFNPPRYLHLLETIPGPQTDPALVDALRLSRRPCSARVS